MLPFPNPLGRRMMAALAFAVGLPLAVLVAISGDTRPSALKGQATNVCWAPMGGDGVCESGWHETTGGCYAPSDTPCTCNDGTVPEVDGCPGFCGGGSCICSSCSPASSAGGTTGGEDDDPDANPCGCGDGDDFCQDCCDAPESFDDPDYCCDIYDIACADNGGPGGGGTMGGTIGGTTGGSGEDTGDSGGDAGGDGGDTGGESGGGGGDCPEGSLCRDFCELDPTLPICQPSNSSASASSAPSCPDGDHGEFTACVNVCYANYSNCYAQCDEQYDSTAGQHLEHVACTNFCDSVARSCMNGCACGCDAAQCPSGPDGPDGPSSPSGSSQGSACPAGTVQCPSTGETQVMCLCGNMAIDYECPAGACFSCPQGCEPPASSAASSSVTSFGTPMCNADNQCGEKQCGSCSGGIRTCAIPSCVNGSCVWGSIQEECGTHSFPSSPQSSAPSSLSSPQSSSHSSAPPSAASSASSLGLGVCCIDGACVLGQCGTPHPSTAACSAECGMVVTTSGDDGGDIGTTGGDTGGDTGDAGSDSGTDGGDTGTTGGDGGTVGGTTGGTTGGDTGTIGSDDGGEIPSSFAFSSPPPTSSASSFLLVIASSESPVQASSSPPPPVCGNGIVEAGEQCDLGADNGRPGFGCRADCTAVFIPGDPACGNGIVEPGQECDDGNAIDDDACTNDCRINTSASSFGRGVTPEDPFFDPPVCGNNRIEPPEECDPPGQSVTLGDGTVAVCSSICRIVFSTVLAQQMDSEDQLAGIFLQYSSSEAEAPVLASASICGNGLLEPGEECDDGNRISGDGCSSACLLEVGICGDGKVQTLLGEQCESSLHDPSLPYDCVNCRYVSPLCGNGTIDPGEECDDGPQNSNAPGARCREDCSLARCGDGILDPNEECDDGNRVDGDGCSSSCRLETTVAGVQVRPPTVASQLITFPQRHDPSPSLATLQPLIAGTAPVGDTGPAAVIVIGAGAAAGWAWMRRRSP